MCNRDDEWGEATTVHQDQLEGEEELVHYIERGKAERRRLQRPLSQGGMGQTTGGLGKKGESQPLWASKDRETERERDGTTPRRDKKTR